DPQFSRANYCFIQSARLECEHEDNQHKDAKHQHRADRFFAPHLDNNVFEDNCGERLHRLTPPRIYDAYASRIAESLAFPVNTTLPLSIIAARVAPRRP